MQNLLVLSNGRLMPSRCVMVNPNFYPPPPPSKFNMHQSLPRIDSPGTALSNGTFNVKTTKKLWQTSKATRVMLLNPIQK